MLDYHVHPNFSIDAKGSVDEFCDAAVGKGLRHICFTTHVDTDPFRNDGVVRVGKDEIPTTKNTWLGPYVETINEAAQIYQEKGLEVRLGVEVDYYSGFESNLPQEFHTFDWDYVLGATHLLEHKALSLEDEATGIFSKYKVDELGELYYGKLVDCIKSGFFDAIAHIDIYRRYGELFYGEEVRTLWKQYVSEIASAMYKANVGFEINTSSFRTGLDDTMPTKEFIQCLHDEGVEIVIVGSDAHSPEYVGYRIDAALRILRDCGFEAVTIFRQREPFQIQVI
ncbi:MAG: histidinol-phosphatase HisJ family protein [Promethearchaeia archaeon]